MTDLKPCPFCGGEVHFYGWNDGNDGGYDIQCATSDCFMEDGAEYCDSKEYVANLWNKRAD